MYQVHRKAPQTLQNRALAPEPTCLISFQPLFPTRSRRSFVKRGAFVPFTVRQTKISIGTMAVFLFWRRVDDPTDVTRLAYNEALLTTVHFLKPTITVRPSRNMVSFAGNRAERDSDIRQVQRLVKKRNPQLGKLILLAQATQILHGHFAQQAGGITTLE